MNPKYTVIFTLLCIVIKTHSAYAGWTEPKEIISETFGSADNQVGRTPSDTPPDSIPEGFWILTEKIVVRDTENRRIKIYSLDGVPEKIVNWTKQPNGSFKIPEYPLAGTFIGYADNNLITYFSPQEYFVFYSMSGQLIKTSKTKPVELGVIQDNSEAKKGHKISIVYPDRTYILDSASVYKKYVRNFKGHLYALYPGGVLHFNENGKKCAELLTSKPGLESVAIADQRFKYIADDTEYGAPILAPNGDVYMWKSTPFKYSIIKWRWLDKPDAAGSCRSKERAGK